MFAQLRKSATVTVTLKPIIQRQIERWKRHSRRSLG
jgi:hypothetical protein